MPATSTPIDEYLESLESPAKETLTRLCTQLRKLLPGATETISYRMPAFRMPNGKVAAGFAFFGKNCGYYPHSGNVVPKLKAVLKPYKTSTGGITFPPDQALPLTVVKALVSTRLAEIGGAVPKPSRAKKATTGRSVKKPVELAAKKRAKA